MVSPISNSESTNFFIHYLFSTRKLRKTNFGTIRNFREKIFKKTVPKKSAPKYCFCKPFRFLWQHFPNFYLIRGLDPTNHSPGEIVQVGFDLNFHRHNNWWILRFLDYINIDPNIAEQRRGAIVKCSDLKLIIISHIVFEFSGRSQSAILHNWNNNGKN